MTAQEKRLNMFHNNRKTQRYKLQTRQLPGQLFVADSDVPVFAVAVDVSEEGLGISANVQLPPDTILRFEAANHTIMLKVIWNQSRGDRFRHGLKKLSNEVNLENLFFSEGTIDLNVDDLPDDSE